MTILGIIGDHLTSFLPHLPGGTYQGQEIMADIVVVMYPHICLHIIPFTSQPKTSFHIPFLMRLISNVSSGCLWSPGISWHKPELGAQEQKGKISHLFLKASITCGSSTSSGQGLQAGKAEHLVTSCRSKWILVLHRLPFKRSFMQDQTLAALELIFKLKWLPYDMRET